MKHHLGYSKLVFLFMLVLLFSCGGSGGGSGGGSAGDGGDGDGGGTNNGGSEDYRSDYMVGPGGAVLTLDDPNSPCYGVTVEVAPGELPEYRTFYLTDDRLNVSVTPYLSTGFMSFPRRREGVFEIKTSGDAPYDVDITMTLPLTDADLEVGTGEVICAFYWDKTTDKWRFVMPASIDTGARTMTVVTTYREVWNWGKVDIQEMDRACLEAAMKDRMGQSEFAVIIAEIERIESDIRAQDIDIGNCTHLRNLQSGLLEILRQSARDRLTAAWPHIDPLCGSCDPLSSQFGNELRTYIENKMEIWMMELLADHTDNLLVEFILRLDLLICDFEIRNLACNYRCVHNELGIGFWLDYAQYELAGALQYLIDWYIGVSEMSCT